MLRTRVKPLFESRGMTFHVDYINNIRNWTDSLPKFAPMFGAYKRRSITDPKIAPHSFTFIRRESNLFEKRSFSEASSTNVARGCKL